MVTLIVGQGEFRFSAAHTALHDGAFERLHGHTYEVAARLSGPPDETGLVIDFAAVRQILGDALAPLQRRTLIAEQSPPPVRLDYPDNGVLSISDGHKTYALPCEDVLLLPVVNTTTEALADYLLDRILPHLLLASSALTVVELELAEAPGARAVARRVLG